MINSLLRRLIKFLISFVHLSFLEFQAFPHYLVAKLHLNHCKASPCVFIYPFFQFDHSFVNGVLHGGSTWWFIKDLFPSRSFHRDSFKELKLSSSCNSECNSFFRTIGGGIMSFLIIFLRASCFSSYQEWGILNASTSSLELSWVIFHLKPSLRCVAIYGAYKWPKFFIYPPGEISSRLLVHSNPILSPVSGRLSPHNLRCIP